MPVVGFLSGWKPVATDMTRPPSPLTMLIATYTRRRRSEGGAIFLHEAGGRTDSGRIVLGMLSVYLRSCRVHVALPLLSSVLVHSCVGCLLSSRNVYQLYATREVCDEASERGSEDYMDSVMSKTPPTAKKAVGSGALVVPIAIIPRARRLRRQLLCSIVSLSGRFMPS